MPGQLQAHRRRHQMRPSGRCQRSQQPSCCRWPWPRSSADFRAYLPPLQLGVHRSRRLQSVDAAAAWASAYLAMCFKCSLSSAYVSVGKSVGVSKKTLVFLPQSCFSFSLRLEHQSQQAPADAQHASRLCNVRVKTTLSKLLEPLLTSRLLSPGRRHLRHRCLSRVRKYSVSRCTRRFPPGCMSTCCPSCSCTRWQPTSIWSATTISSRIKRIPS